MSTKPNREPVRATHELIRRLEREGRWAEARRVAAAMLAANPGDLEAWRLLARTLAQADDPRALVAYERLVDAYANAGDLPMALVAAVELRGTGAPTTPALEALAERYSSCAEHLVDDWRPAPPPLPAAIEVDLTKQDGLDPAIDDALRRAVGAAEEAPGECRFFPLFSSLSPEAFIRFAEHLKVRHAQPDEVIVEQGKPADSFYVLARGEVRVERSAGDDETVLARLGPGAFFGEMAIVTRAPRAASVRAAGDVTVLEAEMSLMQELQDRTPEVRDVLAAFCRARMLENVIAASSILGRIPPDRRADVLSRFEESVHAKGTEIMREGDEAKGLWLLVSGSVAVTRAEQDDVLTLARLGPGEFFGEISLVLRRPATATVTAESDTACLFLPREVFLETVRDHPELLSELYETALERDDETTSILAREAECADDLVML